MDFPSRECVAVQLGRRRTNKPTPEQIAEGVYYAQFGVEHWQATYAAPQLFAAIEKHMEGKETDDPFTWVQQRAAVAAGYSIEGIGRDCSTSFLAQAYESMASTACNTAPNYHAELREFEVGPEEENLLVELYGRHAATVCPEAVATVLAHAIVLTPEQIRTSQTMQAFFARLPDLLQNGLNIDRIEEYTRAPCNEEGTLFNRLESAMRMAVHIYGGQQKPWWFKEDFDMAAYFVEDQEPNREGRHMMRNTTAGRPVMERLAEIAGFAFQHVLEPYCAVGYRLAELEPFTQDDAMRYTANVVRQYGIGNPRRAIAVLWHCLHIVQQEEPARRAERLRQVCMHLEHVRPASPTIGAMESSRPVFALPGVDRLAATMLGRSLTVSGKVHVQRIGFDTLHAIGEKFREPLAQRARTYVPALPHFAQDMERRGLLPGQSNEAKPLLPVAASHVAVAAPQNPVLGVMDFYQQLREECDGTDESVANIYCRFCAARMPDPWHPPKGFLRFLQLFDQIETPGWRFTGLEHPNDRPAVAEENARREIGKQMLVANMLDAWIMGLLTGPELEALCVWLTTDLRPEQNIAIEKDVHWNWHERLQSLRGTGHAAQSDNTYGQRQEDEYERDRRQRRNADAGRTLSPEAHAAPITADDREATMIEDMDRDIRSVKLSRTNQLRRNRMMALQETFGTLSIINSMAIAAVIPHAALRDMLKKSVLPQLLDTDEEAVASGPQPQAAGVLLSNLVRLQEIGALDPDALRNAVEQSETPEQAFDVVQDFLQRVLVRCMEESVNTSLPNAIARVTKVMQEVSAWDDSEQATSTLGHAIGNVRRELEEELDRIWAGAPFVAQDIVHRLLTQFRVPQYATLFPHIHNFNRHTLPAALPPRTEQQRFADLHDSNAHTARAFHFVGSRIIQEHTGDGDERRGLRLMEQRHGSGSRINMQAGASMVRDLALRQADPDTEDTAGLYAGLAQRLPEFLAQVEQWRLDDVPLGPIGGRWHFGNPVSDKHLELMKHLLSLGQTPFRMIHSNTSLIIPGFMSKNEMRLFIFMLALEGLVDPTKPELQLGITGRLSPEFCAYFGSSCMLGTAECAPFKLDSFVPNSPENHHLTAARIVAYDAYPESYGERRNFELPFMFQGAPSSGKNVAGRTDILGRWHVDWKPTQQRPNIYTMDDVDIAHVVGASLRHVQYGGPLREAGLGYMERHREILGDYGLEDTLKAPWVYARGEHESYADSSKNPEHFDRCVKACMDVHFAHAGSFGEQRGAVYDVRQNIALLMLQAEEVGQALRTDPEYADDIRALRLKTS